MVKNSGRKIFDNSISLIIVAFVTKGSKLLSLLIIVRYFDQEIFGQYALILASSELFRSIGDFGIDVTVVKWFANRERNHKSILLNAAALRLVTVSIGAVLLIATSAILGYGSTIMWGIVLASVGYYFGLWGSLLKAPFQAELSTRKLVVPSLVVSALYLGFVALGSWIGINILLLVSFAVLSDLIFFLYLLDQARRRGLIQGSSLDRGQMRDIFRSSLPLGILGIIVVGYARISSLIVAQLGGEVALAHYTSASRITEALLIATSAFAASMLPVLAAAINPMGDKKAAQPLFVAYLTKMGFITTFLSLILSLFSKQIISLTFTDAYLDAAPSLAVLGCSVLFASYNMFLSNALYASDKQSVVLFICVGNLLVNLILSFSLIPQWGFLGAAAATTVTEFWNTIVQLFVLTKISGMFQFDNRIGMTVLRFFSWTVAGFGLSIVVEDSIPILLGLFVMTVYLSQLFFFKDFVVGDIAKLLKPQVSEG